MDVFKAIEGLEWMKTAHRRMPIIKSYDFFRSNADAELFKKKTGVKAAVYNCILLNGDWYFYKKEFDEYRHLIGNTMVKNPRLISEMIARCKVDSTRLMKDAKKVNDWKSLKQWLEVAYGVFPYIVVVYGLDIIVEPRLKELIKKNFSSDEQEEVYNTITMPIQENGPLVERRKLLEIISDDKLDSKEKKLKQHYNEWVWISTAGYYQKPWSWEEFLERVDKLEKENPKKLLKEYIERREQLSKDFEKILNSVDKPTAEFFRIVNEYIYFRTYRTDAFHNASFYIAKFLKSFNSKLGFEDTQIAYLKPDEIIRLVKGEVKEAELKELKQKSALTMKGYALVILDNKISLLTGKDADKVKNILLKDLGDVSEVKGVIANKGKVKGRVRIVKTKQDINDMQSGEVLVAPMTHPRHIIAMEKASAFVTDEGGITCHAAIVSREMNKPCIISTKIATQVLKNGDMVEVDADKGVVRKIE